MSLLRKQEGSLPPLARPSKGVGEGENLGRADEMSALRVEPLSSGKMFVTFQPNEEAMFFPLPCGRAGCVVACKPLLLALHPCRHSTYCGPDTATQPAPCGTV